MKYLIKKLNDIPEKLQNSSVRIEKYIESMEEEGDLSYLTEIFSEITNLIQNLHLSTIMSAVVRYTNKKS